MPTSHVTVDFGSVDKQEDFSLDLDKNKILEAYGVDNKSTFAPEETAYLRLIRSSDEEYNLYVSAGVINTATRNIHYSKSEDIAFPATRTESLANIPLKSVTWAWMGKAPGEPLFSRRNIRLSLASDDIVPVGILRCEYEVNGDRLNLKVTADDMGGWDEMEVLVVAIQGERKATTRVKYDTGLGGDPVPINLLVKDFCSDEKIVDVDVYLDGEYVGQTNGTGKIYLGMLVPSSVHNLKMTKTGYVDSDLDVLHNDSFTVPAPYTRRETIDNLEQELTDLKDQIADIEVKISNLQNEE